MNAVYHSNCKEFTEFARPCGRIKCIFSNHLLCVFFFFFVCETVAGFDAAPDRTVLDADYLGPLPSVPVRTIDWLLVFSVLFIVGFTLYAILRTDSIRWLVPGQEHEHQE